MSRRSYAKLTSKEEQRVVALRAEGLTFDVIAARIGCSKGTVWNALRAHGLASVPSSTSNCTESSTAEKCTDAISVVRALVKKIEALE